MSYILVGGKYGGKGRGCQEMLVATKKWYVFGNGRSRTQYAPEFPLYIASMCWRGVVAVSRGGDVLC
jgi:hypothetical protein